MAQTEARKLYIECGEGWKGLYEPLLALCELYSIPVAQVKEKFGGLRFYTDRVDDRVDQLIKAAESASYHTCESCGTDKVTGWQTEGKPVYLVTTSGGWLKSLCPDCRAGKEKENGAVKP